jgi:hypothetical protein
VKAFGVNPVREAFERGALNVRCQALTVGQIAQYDPGGTGRALGPLSYKFATVRSVYLAGEVGDPATRLALLSTADRHDLGAAVVQAIRRIDDRLPRT